MVSAVEQAGVVASESVMLSTEWRIRMLSNTLPARRLSHIKERSLEETVEDFAADYERFLYAELGLAYTRYLNKEAEISGAEASSNLART